MTDYLADQRGFSRDLIADVVLGQKDFTDIVPYYPINGNRVYNPCGVAIDTNVTPNRLYVLDIGHNRILGYDWTGVPSLGAPVIVLGQPDLLSGGPNGDGAGTSYSFNQTNAPATNASLAFTSPTSGSPAEGGGGSAIYIDDDSNVWVCDFENHRVLRFPFNSTTADVVIGQPNFTANTRWAGLGAVSASGLWFSWTNFTGTGDNSFATGLCGDGSGGLWVCDSGDARVLHYAAGQVIPDLVLGQGGFNSLTPGTTLSKFRNPVSVALSPSTGRLYVADPANDRVVYFTPPFSTAMAATATFSPAATTLQKPMIVQVDPNHPGYIWIMDTTGGYAYLVNETTNAILKQLGNGTGSLIGHQEGVGGSFGIDLNENVLISSQRTNENQVTAFDTRDYEAVVLADSPNAYWRLSDAFAATGTATAVDATTLTHSGAGWTVNAFAGMVVFMVSASATIISNTSDTLTFGSWSAATPTLGSYNISAPQTEEIGGLGLDAFRGLVTYATTSGPKTGRVVLGSGAYLFRADAAALDVGDTFTLEIWFKRNNTGARTLIGKGTGAYQFGFNASNNLILLKTGTAGEIVSSSTSYTVDGLWHHAAVTKDGASRKMYADGVDVTVLGTNQTLTDNSVNLNIGREPSGGSGVFDGQLAEAAIYDYVLSQSEIEARIAGGYESLYSNTDKYSAYGFAVINGLAVTDEQLIVADEGRILFWNDLSSLYNGKPADGYLAGTLASDTVAGFDDVSGTFAYSISVDSNYEHLWVSTCSAGGLSAGIICYELPLTSGDTPILRLGQAVGGQDINVLGGGTMDIFGHQAINFVSVADNGGGKCRFTLASEYPFVNGDSVTISGSSVGAYDGTRAITYVSTTTFDMLTLNFSATATGSAISAQNGTEIGQNWGMAPNADSTELWVSCSRINKTVRIRNPLTSPLIDAVLGQAAITGLLPNRVSWALDAATIRASKTDSTLYVPGDCALDSDGNLYLQDHTLETQGNFRFLIFQASDIPSGNAAIILGPAAWKNYPGIAGWEPAIAPTGELVMGYNFYDPGGIGNANFPGAYLDPLGASENPDADDNAVDFYSMATAACFDPDGNLYIADHNRNLIRIYYAPFGRLSQLVATPPAHLARGFGFPLDVLVSELYNDDDVIPTGTVTLRMYASSALTTPLYTALRTLDSEGKCQFFVSDNYDVRTVFNEIVGNVPVAYVVLSYSGDGTFPSCEETYEISNKDYYHNVP